MRESKFNYFVEDGQTVIIFNSLTGKLATLNKDTYSKLQIGNFDSVNNLDELIRHGLIVDDEEDEEKKAFLKYMNAVNDKTLELIILPTMGCNFRCPYCYENHEGTLMSDTLIDNIVKFASERIAYSQRIHVSWFGGEPLVGISVIEKLAPKLIQLARKYKKPYSSNMTTNGYLLDFDTFMKMFHKYRITNYQITLDGRAQFHNKTRPLVTGGPTYETIMSNLMEIKNKCSSPLFRIMIRSNLTKETVNDLDNEIAEMEERFAGDNRFTFLFKRAGNWGGDTVNTIKGELIGKEDEWYKRISELKTSLNLETRYFFVESFNICYAAKSNTYTIDPTGKVMRCTVHLDAEWNVIGQINEDGSFTRNDKNHTKWEYPTTTRKDLSKKCHNCRLYANCFGINCPIHIVSSKESMPCDDKAKELLGFYKSNPEKFIAL